MTFEFRKEIIGGTTLGETLEKYREVAMKFSQLAESVVTSAKELLSSNTNMLFVLVIFIGYIIARSLGKYFGAFAGCKITKRDKNITNYLGITLLPQAGVAIGMANQISSMEAFSGGSGSIIVTVVLCATLVYELVGPFLTKMALQKAGEIPTIDGIYPYQNH